MKSIKLVIALELLKNCNVGRSNIRAYPIEMPMNTRFGDLFKDDLIFKRIIPAK